MEVGSWKGRSAIYLAHEILAANKSIRLDCVDTWEGSSEHQEGELNHDPLLLDKDALYKTFLTNVSPYRAIINPIRMHSFAASQLYADESLDFVFLDSAHEYEHLMEELILWFPKLKKTGIISGHDFAVEPVQRAVYTFFNSLDICVSRSIKCQVVATDISWIHFMDGNICDDAFYGSDFAFYPASCPQHQMHQQQLVTAPMDTSSSVAAYQTSDIALTNGRLSIDQILSGEELGQNWFTFPKVTLYRMYIFG